MGSLKDLRTAHEFAGQLALPLPGSHLVAAMMETLSTQGADGQGWQVLIREFETRGGFSIPAPGTA